MINDLHHLLTLTRKVVNFITGVTTVSRAPKRTYPNLARRLQDVGYAKDFVERALLPEWWSKECAKDPALLPGVEFSVARFLSAPLETVADPTKPLSVPSVDQNAKLRAPKSFNAEGLAPCMFAAIKVADAVVRNLRGAPRYRPLPTDPNEFRKEVMKGGEAVTLRRLVERLWEHGIPVLRVPSLPSPKFHGMACMVEGRPVILVAHAHKHEPRLLITIAHETGHVAKGHVTPESSTLDVEDGAYDAEPDYEKEANKYAQLLKCDDMPSNNLGISDPKTIDGTQLAATARGFAKQHHVDAGLLLHYWQIKTGEFGRASRAMGILGKTDAPGILENQARRYIRAEEASETDARLLGCIFSD